MEPDESLFKKHLEEALFQEGVEENRWGLVGTIQEINWPYVILWCKSTPHAGAGFNKYYFRFDLKNYPATAPTAIPWDIEKNQRLANELWPSWSERLRKVFNYNWNSGRSLYAPCDRLAMPLHGKWAEKHYTYWWTSDSTIIKYLRFLESLLNETQI
jgi:hypothetical protein